MSTLTGGDLVRLGWGNWYGAKQPTDDRLYDEQYGPCSPHRRPPPTGQRIDSLRPRRWDAVRRMYVCPQWDDYGTEANPARPDLVETNRRTVWAIEEEIRAEYAEARRACRARMLERTPLDQLRERWRLAGQLCGVTDAA